MDQLMSTHSYAETAVIVEKADPVDFLGRFREIISDPLNMLIHRHPLAGCVVERCVILHNGIRVPVSGEMAYYGSFSHILVINRGVHEPLEEFVFQEMVPRLSSDPIMLELGAYWGHYSMWLKSVLPKASVYMVEPEPLHIKAGRENFAMNGMTGDFLQAFVGKGFFEVDQYMSERQLSFLDILHSDIQGYELEMLDGASCALRQHSIRFIFVSTHSQQIHIDVLNRLRGHGYRVEVSADFSHQTTSFDGFIFASSPLVEPVFSQFQPLGRIEILQSDPAKLVGSISGYSRRFTERT